MRIAMFTNTYLPHVGGVAHSVLTLENACRRAGHEVRIIAPEFEGAEPDPEVLRVPAIQNFHGSDFSFRLPSPLMIREFMDDFQPDIVHTHHPFLLGDAAVREAWKLRVPIVFTHHTMYERYTHFVPLDSDALKRMAIQMATEYCNLCDLVIAPSESVATLLLDRGVTVPLRVVPTGVDTSKLAGADGGIFRKKYGISLDAKVLGHVGRLSEEKNLRYLADAVVRALESEPQVFFLLVGNGDSRAALEEILAEKVPGRFLATGQLTGRELLEAYAAMDLFAFASHSETQGMVLAEAMAAGVPVVALDAPGVREIVKSGVNGRLLDRGATTEAFAAAISELLGDDANLEIYARGARETAKEYDVEICAAAVLAAYRGLVENADREDGDFPQWDRVLAGIDAEWNLLGARLSAASAALFETTATEVRLD